MKQVGFAMLVSVLAVTVSTGAAAQRVTIDQQDVKAKRICGTKMGKVGCKTSKFGLTLSENDLPLSASSEDTRYLAVLGKVVRKGDNRGTYNSLYPCAKSGLVEMKPSIHIDKIEDPRPFDYERRADLVKYADLGLDIKALLTASGVPAAKIAPLEATFKATYGKTANRKFTMKGKYYRVTLTDDARNQIRASAATDPAAKNCGEFLRSQLEQGSEYNLIHSISIIELESGSYVGDVVSKLTADFASKVKKAAPEADVATLNAGISNTVRTKLNVEIGKESRVIAWDYLSL